MRKKSIYNATHTHSLTNRRGRTKNGTNWNSSLWIELLPIRKNHRSYDTHKHIRIHSIVDVVEDEHEVLPLTNRVHVVSVCWYVWWLWQKCFCLFVCMRIVRKRVKPAIWQVGAACDRCLYVSVWRALTLSHQLDDNKKCEFYGRNCVWKEERRARSESERLRWTLSVRASEQRGGKERLIH